jgi:hypothetical protein
MLVLFGVALLILAAGVVVLFAMLGELAARVPEPGAAQHVPTVRPLEEALIGHTATVWPESLPDARSAVLLVLSPVCGSCAEIARQLGERPGYAAWQELGVVVSAASRDAGLDFLARHGLQEFPNYVDEAGAWVGGAYGVRISPVALVLHGGRLAAAYSFNDIEALRQKVGFDRRTGPESKPEYSREAAL